MTLTPRFRTPAYRPFRAFMFASMGLSAVVPVIHGVTIFGVAQMNKQMGLSWLTLQGVLYLVGAGLYAVCTNLLPSLLSPGPFPPLVYMLPDFWWLS